MKSTPELIRMAERAQELHGKFDETNRLLIEKLETVENLLDTRKKLDEEAGKQSDDWEKSLLASGGVESEKSDKATLLGGLARQKLERIDPLIYSARKEALMLRCSTAEAAIEYSNAWLNLCRPLIESECKHLVNSLRPTLKIINGLLGPSPLPSDTLEYMVMNLIREIESNNNNAAAQEYLSEVTRDKENAMNLYPGAFPGEMQNAMRSSPSGAQMALARNKEDMMRALAEGREPCKGLG